MISCWVQNSGTPLNTVGYQAQKVTKHNTEKSKEDNIVNYIMQEIILLKGIRAHKEVNNCMNIHTDQ